MSVAGPASIAADVRGRKPTLWLNPLLDGPSPPTPDIDRAANDAADRFERAAPLFSRLFPTSDGTDVAIHSPLLRTAHVAQALGFAEASAGRWFIKADHALPVAGSVKARGGFHEVLAHAEGLAIAHGLAQPKGDLLALASDAARQLFSRHAIVVGSTGNLGMSIGLMSAALGFRATVHMSSDAKAWKKVKLRDSGVTVVEHSGDYGAAVELGRKESLADPLSYFVDDERSVGLLVGYATAAAELASQLDKAGTPVDAAHPLFVYLPCGVGGAPGGVTYGLKKQFGPHVHCFFAQPVASPCMLVQQLSGMEKPISVYDWGLDNRTEADGMAVAQASMLVAPLMQTRMSGCYTVSDDQLYFIMKRLYETETIKIEPSAAAGLLGPLMLMGHASGETYRSVRSLAPSLHNGTHVMWTTGGSLMPDSEFERFLSRAAGVPDTVLQV